MNALPRIETLPGIKQEHVRACDLCGTPHESPVFYRIRCEQYVFDTNAVQRQVGLEQMMGGNHAAGFPADAAKRG